MAMNDGRFILFDQTGDRGRILLDPNVYYEVPNVGAGLEQAGHVYRDAMASAFTALQTMRDSRPYSITLCGLRDGFQPAGSDSDNGSFSWGGSEEMQASAVNDKVMDEYEEDAEDIEALLYSDEEDEEFSTGHSPSDLTSQDDEDHSDSQEEISSVLRNVEETDNSGSQVAAALRRVKKPVFNSKKPFTAGRLSVKRRRARKERIRQTVRILQSLVPGGRCLDPAVILDQAIHYMKSLQMKVLELEAGRQATK